MCVGRDRVRRRLVQKLRQTPLIDKLERVSVEFAEDNFSRGTAAIIRCQSQ